MVLSVVDVLLLLIDSLDIVIHIQEYLASYQPNNIFSSGPGTS
jgi:hypothetical protein